MDPAMDFGLAVRRLRTERGLSLRVLGALTHYSHAHLHDVEHGRAKATPELAARLDEALEADGELITILSPTPTTPDNATRQAIHERFERMLLLYRRFAP